MLSTLEGPDADRFREEVREWLRRELPSSWIDYGIDDECVLPGSEFDGLTEGSWKIGSGGVHRGWDRKLAGARYYCMTWPTEYGGRDLGALEEFIFYDECARVHAPDGFEVQGRFNVGPLLLWIGTPEQQAKYLLDISAAESVWCGGLSEPSAGSDLASLRTEARQVDGGYRIYGEKIWTGFAAIAEHCLLLAKTADGPRYKNLSYLILDMRQPGIEVIPLRQATGTYGFNHVTFTGPYVPTANVVGRENEGWQVAVGALAHERGATSALRRYVTLRETADQLRSCTSGHREGAVTCDHVRPLLVRLELLRAHIARVASADQNGAADAGASLLHVLWSELWQDIADYGVSLKCLTHEYYWRMRYLQTRPATIYGGTAQIQRNIIAERVLGLPK
jgi:alkylation response protein AidB-like acyl-CoA dehydrogenase